MCRALLRGLLAHKLVTWVSIWEGTKVIGKGMYRNCRGLLPFQDCRAWEVWSQRRPSAPCTYFVDWVAPASQNVLSCLSRKFSSCANKQCHTQPRLELEACQSTLLLLNPCVQQMQMSEFCKQMLCSFSCRATKNKTSGGGEVLITLRKGSAHKWQLDSDKCGVVARYNRYSSFKIFHCKSQTGLCIRNFNNRPSQMTDRYSGLSVTLLVTTRHLL